MVCGKLGEKKSQVSDLMSDKKQSDKKTKTGEDWRSKAMGFVKDELGKPSQGSSQGGSKQWYDDIVQSVMAGITK